MKHVFFFFLLIHSSFGYSQNESSKWIEPASIETISTLDFVQVLNDNMEEALYYYKNNWQILRDTALANGYILSFELMKTNYTEEAPFHLILKTTYQNQAQFDKRETNFDAIIERRGEIQLLNEKQPADFRKIIFWKEPVIHLE